MRRLKNKKMKHLQRIVRPKKQKVAIQVTLILEIKLEKYIFLSKDDHFFSKLGVHF